MDTKKKIQVDKQKIGYKNASGCTNWNDKTKYKVYVQQIGERIKLRDNVKMGQFPGTEKIAKMWYCFEKVRAPLRPNS